MNDAVVEGLAQARKTTPAEILGPRLARIPLNRLAQANEVAAVICFLLSDEASYMTGQPVNVTGGLVMS